MSILTPTLPTVKAAASVEFVVAPQPSNRELYNAGFNAYCDGAPYHAMTTTAARRGWMAANKAEAEAGIAGYAQKRGW